MGSFANFSSYFCVAVMAGPGLALAKQPLVLLVIHGPFNFKSRPIDLCPAIRGS